eukprot:6180318-Pleurochrysis_carterae.AAC.2
MNDLSLRTRLSFHTSSALSMTTLYLSTATTRQIAPRTFKHAFKRGVQPTAGAQQEQERLLSFRNHIFQKSGCALLFAMTASTPSTHSRLHCLSRAEVSHFRRFQEHWLNIEVWRDARQPTDASYIADMSVQTSEAEKLKRVAGRGQKSGQSGKGGAKYGEWNKDKTKENTHKSRKRAKQKFIDGANADEETCD